MTPTAVLYSMAVLLAVAMVAIVVLARRVRAEVRRERDRRAVAAAWERWISDNDVIGADPAPRLHTSPGGER